MRSLNSSDINHKQNETNNINSPGDVGGWPELKSEPAPPDSDHDGIPDEWEKANGLDPHDASDRNNFAANGYTMLEEYLNDIIEK